MPIIDVSHKRIANFELLELIGAGGMANIYKGVQLSLERPVAIKILHQHLTANEDFVARFKQEAKQAAILQHQNIVSIIDYGHHDGEYFIAMEYIDGHNLKEVLTRIERFPLEVAMLIVREVAAGLKYAHSQGLIHRDIKPANIMLAKDGRVVITDFGIAKTHGDMSITVTGQTVGSPAYMSPEQAAGRPIDHRCDIFSLGIVFYETVTGEKPFKGDTYQEAMTSVISAIPPQPSSLRTDVTPTIENMITKALEKVIDNRFKDVEELAVQLNDELGHYIIPSEKKLVAEFVKNPIRIAQKLRTDRISKHMESALYYVNIGHGRLSDAIKEFENVLRYDKKNKLAKQYLEKLKTGQEGFAGKKKLIKVTWPQRIIAIMVMLICLGSLIYLIRASGRNSTPATTSTSQAQAESQEQNIENRPVENLQPVKSDVTPETPKKSTSNKTQATISPKPSPSTERSTSSSKPLTTSSKPPTKTSRTSKTVSPPKQKTQTTQPPPVSAPAKGSKYDYPNQNLSKYGTLKLVSEPPADFSIDFRDYGVTCGPLIKLSPGRHMVVVKASGYRTERKRIYTEEGKSETLEFSLKRED